MLQLTSLNVMIKISDLRKNWGISFECHLLLPSMQPFGKLLMFHHTLQMISNLILFYTTS